MLWVQVAIATIGLAREIVKYLRDRECKDTVKQRTEILRDKIKETRLNGSGDKFHDQ